MAATAVIGGQARHLSAWRPSPIRYQGIKPACHPAALPMVHTIEGVPTDYDQGSISSCTANTLAEMYEYDLHGRYSRLFSYFWTRATEGDPVDDTGVTIPDLLSSAHTMGLPPEELWPYDVSKFDAVPPPDLLLEAIKRRVMQWDVIVDLDHLLYEVGHDQPIILGFNVPASMADGAGDTARTGIVRVPSQTDPKIGAHCVLAMGYSRTDRVVRTTSHYGPNYGDHGTLLLPFEHWTSGNVKDMSAIRAIS